MEYNHDGDGRCPLDGEPRQGNTRPRAQRKLQLCLASAQGICAPIYLSFNFVRCLVTLPSPSTSWQAIRRSSLCSAVQPRKMAVLHRKPSRRGGLRPQLWIDPNPLTDELPAPLPTPASSADPITSLAPSSDPDTATPTSSTELFYVLCLYDYDAEDSDQLSFRRNDILDVVKKEDTVSLLRVPPQRWFGRRLNARQGWWAAVRLDENKVGWIPSAFVEPISDALADKLRGVGAEVAIYRDDSDGIHGSPELFTDPFASADGEHRGYDWMPLVNGDKVCMS